MMSVTHQEIKKQEVLSQAQSNKFQWLHLKLKRAKEGQTGSYKQEICNSVCMSPGDQARPFAHCVPHPPCEQSAWHVFMISRITCILNDVFFSQWQTFRELICIETSNTSRYGYQLHIVCGFPQD